MNRRQAIRRVVGVGAGLAAIPLMSKTGEGASVPSYGPPTVAPEWKEPPLDHRTPEQVVEAADATWAASIVKDMQGDYTKYNHFHYTLPPRIFMRVESLLHDQGIPFEKRDIAGRPSLIANGNVLSQEYPITVYVTSTTSTSGI